VLQCSRWESEQAALGGRGRTGRRVVRSRRADARRTGQRGLAVVAAGVHLPGRLSLFMRVHCLQGAGVDARADPRL